MPNPNKNPEFDLRLYKLEQIIEALTCPVNRHATREEHQCDDWHLHENPNLLIIHFIEKGGAEEFAKRRAEFLNFCELADKCEYQDSCDLCKMKSDYLKCPIRGKQLPSKLSCPVAENADKS